MQINAKQLNEVVKFAATPKNEPYAAQLHHVLVEPGQVVATDRHILIQVNKSDLTDEEYPGVGVKDIDEPVLLHPDQIKQATAPLPVKPVLPCMSNIQIGLVDGKPVIRTGLPVVELPVTTDNDLRYPDYKRVIPDYSDQTPLKFALDGKLLRKICDFAAKFGNQFNSEITFEIPTTDTQVKMQDNGIDPVCDADDNLVFEQQPISELKTGLKFTITNTDIGMKASGLIMPLRIND